MWLVKEETSGKELVIKLASGDDKDSRLQREFALLERFEHPGIVKVRDFNQFNDRPYFTMDYVEGEPFDEYLAARRNSDDFIPLFVELVGKIISSLSFIHSQGVVHADLKPANLLVKGKEPVLLDFGFAEDFLLAPTDQPRGTLDFVAPEIFRGEGLSPAADLYSLGAMV